jgi:hypothetical protein
MKETLRGRKFSSDEDIISEVQNWINTQPINCGGPRPRWEGNIKMGLTKIGIDGSNWFYLAQDRFQWRAYLKTVIKLHVPQGKYFLYTERQSAFQIISCFME